MTYMDMLIEYKQSEAALRRRLRQINEMLKSCAEDSAELDKLKRRKITLEQELYDLVNVIGDIYGYIGCGGNEQCRNA